MWYLFIYDCFCLFCQASSWQFMCRYQFDFNKVCFSILVVHLSPTYKGLITWCKTSLVTYNLRLICMWISMVSVCLANIPRASLFIVCCLVHVLFKITGVDCVVELLQCLYCPRSHCYNWSVECCNVQFVYEGVSFLNEEQENVLRRHIAGDQVSNAADRYCILLFVDFSYFVVNMCYCEVVMPENRLCYHQDVKLITCCTAADAVVLLTFFHLYVR